jgi:predicted secreted protein
MASLTGNAGVIKLDDNTGVSQTIAEVRSYSIEQTADTIENSVMGDTTRQYVKGLATFSGTADVYFDATHISTVDIDPTAGSVGASNKIVTLEIYPTGSGTKWAGEVIVTGYSVSASFDGMVEASISFQGTGSVTYS